ncbi:transglycosylase SLT domain-containing protein [Erythrobacter sp. Alg231-14]|uniref:transglycosylase SLT domain-containing protein n=1 Tax=Erythrobacter sp. Alg231-14 TaxID=1922225 RepID=UPI00307C099B
MSNHPIPAAGIQSAFDRAARAHDAFREASARNIPGGVQPTIARQNPPHDIRGQGIETQRPVTVEQAIASAAQQSTVDFDYLIAQAQVESAMNPTARASTSSATGLYQFIESTWLNTMQRHGDRFGLGNVAAQIDTNASGAAYVADPQTRQSILALRNDPQIASFMAAGLAEDNRAHLTPILGRQPDHGELYLAHFLGAGGAGRFLSEMADNPDQSAAALFRRPAAANRPVFYENTGTPRSLSGVMDYLSGKLESARTNAADIATPEYVAASFSIPDFAGSSGVPGTVAPASYAAQDAAMFAPQNPPTFTRGNRPSFATSSNGPLAPTLSQGSMSGVLSSMFGDGLAAVSDRSNGQIRRAYNQLKALGL